MNFIIDQAVLDEALKTVQFALLTRPSLPILNNVKITASEDSVTFLLTDLEIAISCNVPAEVATIGTTTLPTRTLISIVRRLPSQPIEFTTDEDEFTTIRSGEIIFKILGVSAEDFPAPFTNPEENSFEIEKSVIRKMVLYTAVATGNDPGRPIISGPLLKVEEQKLTCVATDGKRLALLSQTADCLCDGSCVIPPKTNNALMKLMAGEGKAKVSFDEKSVEFDFTNEFNQATVISTKLIEGRFPNYKAIIPADFKNEISIPRQELYDALRRISLILSDSDQGVKLVLHNNSLTMHANTEEDESHEELEVSFDGEEIAIAFNPVFLMDPLKRLECEKVTLRFNDSRGAASLEDGENFIYILMPMRM